MTASIASLFRIAFPFPEWEPSGAAPGFRFMIAISEDISKYFYTSCLLAGNSKRGLATYCAVPRRGGKNRSRSLHTACISSRSPSKTIWRLVLSFRSLR